jgi:dipeptidase E
MKKLFLASEIDVVAKHIAKKLDKPVRRYKAVFISTAAEPETGDKQWLKDNKQGLIDIGLNVFDYTITGKKPKDIEKDLKDVDWIHVNGGNTFYLLLQARKSGFDKFVKKAIKKGIIYTGSSAGSIITSPNIEISRILEKKSYEKELRTFEGFNLVDFIILPHWGSSGFKSEYRLKRLETAYKPENKIILLNDFQYVQVVGEYYKIIDTRKD